MRRPAYACVNKVCLSGDVVHGSAGPCPACGAPLALVGEFAPVEPTGIVVEIGRNDFAADNPQRNIMTVPLRYHEQPHDRIYPVAPMVATIQVDGRPVPVDTVIEVATTLRDAGMLPLWRLDDAAIWSGAGETWGPIDTVHPTAEGTDQFAGSLLRHRLRSAAHARLAVAR